MRDSLFLRYGIDSTDLTDHCNSRGAALFICHALDCKKGGLVLACHNELRDGVSNLASKAFTPTHLCEDPKFFTGHDVRGGKSKSKVKGTLPKYEGEMKGDLLIRYLWIQGTDSIHDMCVANADAASHQSQNPKKCLETAERRKNKKYLHTCLNRCRHFSNFFASVDGLLVVEAEVTLKCISSRLATKWKESYSHTCGYMNSRVKSISLGQHTAASGGPRLRPPKSA